MLHFPHLTPDQPAAQPLCQGLWHIRKIAALRQNRPDTMFINPRQNISNRRAAQPIGCAPFSQPLRNQMVDFSGTLNDGLGSSGQADQRSDAAKATAPDDAAHRPKGHCFITPIHPVIVTC